MSQVIFKMPDLGEGTVEAEIVAWRTQPGAVVREDEVIVEVMTDKAAVEVPSPVSGRVVSISGAPGDKIPVGSPLVVFETEAARTDGPAAARSGLNAAAAAAGGAAASAGTRAAAAEADVRAAAPSADARSAVPGRVKTSPANRRRAREAGIDLSTVQGSGPGGRILAADLTAAGSGSGSGSGASGVDRWDTRAGAQTGPAPAATAPSSSAAASAAAANDAGSTEIKVIGLRRLIAERMSESKRTIPHFAYVEEVDVTELEALRRHLNERAKGGAPTAGSVPLTYLPFIVAALARVLEQFPECNATYDAGRGVLVRHRAVHVGIATQTPDGLKVPVVRHAERLDLGALAAAIAAVAERARTGKATREELSGSTITVTSLGKLGGIVSTPVINLPEVAIIGINKAVERPMVHAGAVTVRRMMNLSSSFDHRFVDGYDAAAMIQALKERLEYPATIFIR